MFKTLFKKATIENLIKILDSNTFNENSAQSLAASLDLNYTDEKNQTLIHKMVLHNRIESIQWLCKKGVNLNIEDNDGKTALMLAAQSNNVEMINVLLKLGANADYINKHKRTALQEAAINGNIDAYCTIKRVAKTSDNLDKNNHNVLFDAVVSNNYLMVEEVLLDETVQKDLIDNEEKSVLHLQNAYKNIDIATLLIKYGLDPMIKDIYGKNYLFYLLEGTKEHIPLMEKIILKYPKILNEKDNEGNTIFHELITKLLQEEHLSNQCTSYLFFKALCHHDIDLSITNNKGESAFSMAVNSLRIEIIHLLLENNINPNITNENGETALSLIAVKGSKYKDIVLLLINYGADPNIPDKNHQTIIEKLIDIELFFSNHKKLPIKLRHEISETNDNYIGLLKDILQHAEVNMRKLNSKKMPYIFEAAHYANIPLIKLLSYFGTDINQVGENGLNILYYLMHENENVTNDKKLKQYYESLRVIISLGADVNARDDYGGIVLHKAILSNDIQTVKILIDYGADLSAIDNRGRNMIHNAVWKAKTKILRLIDSKNKKLINNEDKFGVLPIHYAAFLGYTDLVLELINLGSHVNSQKTKGQYILNFLEKFHKNLDTLEKNARNQSDKNKVSILVTNMKKEFNIV